MIHAIARLQRTVAGHDLELNDLFDDRVTAEQFTEVVRDIRADIAAVVDVLGLFGRVLQRWPDALDELASRPARWG
jgi:hypothetical protein